MELLSRIAIEHECARLVVAYTHAIDLDGGEGLAELFAEDAVLETGGEPRIGREGIRAASAAGRGTRFMRHLCSNVLVQVVDDDRATGRCYLTVYVHAPDDHTLGLPTVVGEYHDEFRRTAEGWRFASRRFVPALTAPA